MNIFKKELKTDPTLTLPLEGREFYLGLGGIVLSFKQKTV